MRKLKVGFDCDDVLYRCVSYAFELENKKRMERGLPPLREEDVTGWGKSGKETDAMFDYFDDENFYASQPVAEGAKEMIRRTVALGCEPFIITSVDLKFFATRKQKIAEDFPEIPTDNIFVAPRKDVFSLDVMLDDGMHNLVGDRSISAKYPVLLRKPWNRAVSGIFSVNGCDEFTALIEKLARYSYANTAPNNCHKLICLVGPTGTRKNQIMYELSSHPMFTRICTVTTNPNANDSKPCKAYEIVDSTDFSHIDMIEKSVYNGYEYGIRTSVIEKIWAEGKNAITCIDIPGACSIKKIFGDNVIIVFCKRKTTDIINSILKKNISADEKITRIAAINEELEGEKISDVVLEYDSPSQNAKEILKLI